MKASDKPSWTQPWTGEDHTPGEHGVVPVPSAAHWGVAAQRGRHDLLVPLAALHAACQCWEPAGPHHTVKAQLGGEWGQDQALLTSGAPSKGAVSSLKFRKMLQTNEWDYVDSFGNHELISSHIPFTSIKTKSQCFLQGGADGPGGPPQDLSWPVLRKPSNRGCEASDGSDVYFFSWEGKQEHCVGCEPGS